jgi:hypothetical protein
MMQSNEHYIDRVLNPSIKEKEGKAGEGVEVGEDSLTVTLHVTVTINVAELLSNPSTAIGNALFAGRERLRSPFLTELHNLYPEAIQMIKRYHYNRDLLWSMVRFPGNGTVHGSDLYNKEVASNLLVQQKTILQSLQVESSALQQIVEVLEKLYGDHFEL